MPEEGDLLRTRSGRCYRIDEIRLARPGSKSWATLVCVVLEHDAVQLGEPGVWGWEFSAR